MTNKESKLKAAYNYLEMVGADLNKAEKQAVNAIKAVLSPCKGSPCPIGTDDFADDIYYVYYEPLYNEFRRVMAIRYDVKEDELYVRLDFNSDEEAKDAGADLDWYIPFDYGYVSDLHFLLDEISSNIEYADGYHNA